MSEIFVASEVDAELDNASGDIIIRIRGINKMRMTYTAAKALAARLIEAVEQGEQRPPAPKKEIVLARRRRS